MSEYQHFVCGLKIDGEDYTVHSIVAVDINGERYYGHNLSRIEKVKLLDLIDKGEAVFNNGFGTTPDTKSTTNYAYKDKRLFSILQTNSSKIVDENGEPIVVYHNSYDEIDAFDRGRLGNNTDSNASSVGMASTAHIGFWFADKKLSIMGGNIACYLNVKKPFKVDI